MHGIHARFQNPTCGQAFRPPAVRFCRPDQHDGSSLVHPLAEEHRGVGGSRPGELDLAGCRLSFWIHSIFLFLKVFVSDRHSWRSCRSLRVTENAARPLPGASHFPAELRNAQAQRNGLTGGARTSLSPLRGEGDHRDASVCSFPARCGVPRQDFGSSKFRGMRSCLLTDSVARSQSCRCSLRTCRLLTRTTRSVALDRTSGRLRRVYW
jgi:hypothetical protein